MMKGIPVTDTTPRHAARTFFVVGTYADGAVRTSHVTTPDIEAHEAYMLSGFLPYATITSTPCEDLFTCGHSR